jgi:hypothetical protein
MNSSEKGPIQELWDHRNDPEEWGEEPVEIEARPTGSTIVSFRIPWEEYEELEDAATAKGESLSEFIREALRYRLKGSTLAAFVEMTSGGANQFRLLSDIPARSRGTEASSVLEKPLAGDRDLAGTTP